jgi:hypothetical protein
MSARIQYDSKNTAWGGFAAEFIADLQTVKANGARLRAALYSMSYGTPETWAAIESELGVEAGQGQAFFTIIDAAVTSLNAINNLSDIDQG